MTRRSVGLTLAAGSIGLLSSFLLVSEGARRVALHVQHGSAIAAEPQGRAKTVVVRESPRLIADYYPAAGKAQPQDSLVLLVHGSYPDGRRSFFCRVLAGRLADEGFPVMAVDLTGFGASAEPASPLSDHLRFEDDVRAAARYAVRAGFTRPGRIVYVGHSLGAAVVLRAARLTPRPAAVVALGAPSMRDQQARGEARWRHFASQRLRAMGHPLDETSVQTMGRYLLDLDPTAQRRRGLAVPSLLVFGGEEVHGRSLPAWGSPHGLFVIPEADHEYTLADGPWGLYFYDRTPVRTLTRVIGSWAQTWTS